MYLLLFYHREPDNAALLHVCLPGCGSLTNRLYLLQPKRSHTEENAHEIDMRVIGLWKYVRTGILACLKNQVKNHSKIDNSVNNQKSKTPKYILSKAWKENRDNISWYKQDYYYYTNTSRTDLRKYMTFKVVKQLNPIGAMKTFTKPNCNLCMEERLTILKKLRDKRVKIINKNSEICGAFRHKTCFRRFCLSTGDPVLNGWKG